MRNRVRSKVHAAHEGTVVTETAGVYAVHWDNGSWSYLHKNEFEWIHSLAEATA